MNELLQKHGCANVFTVPEGLRELMSDIAREVLRDQPEKICDYIANYLSVLLITREHGILAVKILDDLCDCKPSVFDHLLQLGIEKTQAEAITQIIKEEVESDEPVEGKDKVKEIQILKMILAKVVLDEDTSAKVCQVARNAYRDYWCRKKIMEKSLTIKQSEPWEIAAERTLQLYKKTKPSFSELTRATEKIQAAYRGYYIRRNILRHLKPKSKKKSTPKTDLAGPPEDIAASREIDLGPIIDVKVREDDVGALFDEAVCEKFGLHYDPMMTLTHLDNEHELVDNHEALAEAQREQKISRSAMHKSVTEASVGSRRARLSTELEVPIEIHEPPTTGRQSSHAPSLAPTNTELHKISFSQMPPEIIVDDIDDMQVPEELGVENASEVVDIKPLTNTETLQEVPEDIRDRSEGDGESVPTESVPSSAPDTANTTDVEDTGEDIDTAGEEGEE